MSIYNVVVLCLITAPVTLVISAQQDASFAFVALAIIFCCFLSMALVFVPKVNILLLLSSRTRDLTLNTLQSFVFSKCEPSLESFVYIKPAPSFFFLTFFLAVLFLSSVFSHPFYSLVFQTIRGICQQHQFTTWASQFYVIFKEYNKFPI